MLSDVRFRDDGNHSGHLLGTAGVDDGQCCEYREETQLRPQLRSAVRLPHTHTNTSHDTVFNWMTPGLFQGRDPPG
jgi:hypothetical protein